jgi:hypothetical protein
MFAGGGMLRLFLPMALLPSLLGGCTGAQWQSYLAKGGVCEVHLAASVVGQGLSGLLADIGQALATQKGPTPDEWAQRALADAPQDIIDEVKCRAAHGLQDLAGGSGATVAVVDGPLGEMPLFASSSDVAIVPIDKRCVHRRVEKRHKPYLEALLRFKPKARP